MFQFVDNKYGHKINRHIDLYEFQFFHIHPQDLV